MKKIPKDKAVIVFAEDNFWGKQLDIVVID